MSDGPIKDVPASVPERAKLRDATVVVPGPVGPLDAAPERTLDSIFPEGLDLPPSTSSIPMSTPPSRREVIVPSSATASSILNHVRKSPADRLEIETRVASGGMGSIDIAVDRALDRRIAIKTLHPHLRSDERTLRMFLREARLTGLLDHPHIVPVYELGEGGNGELFFAMKLVEGQTLAATIRDLPRGALDTATLYALLDVFAKVCDALAFAHSRGVLHCDVKPANVMIGEFGQVFLMDWGIARLFTTEGSPPSVAATADDKKPRLPSATDNSVIGTPGYMSPEQARGDRKMLDVRSDVFLLGALLYEILTHRPPYVCSDRNETLALAAMSAFPNPRKVAGEAAVPPELERIVLRAMAKSPDDRYPSVAALKEDVVRFMRGGAEFPRRTFGAGEVIVREGDAGDAAYIIVDGRCEVRKENNPQILQTLGAGDVFGEMAILTQRPRTATVVASEPTTVLVVTSHVLEQEMAALKPWMATLLTSLASRFRDIDMQARVSAGSTPGHSPSRIANQVLMAVETWGTPDDQGGRWMTWSRLAEELEAQIGAAPIALFAVVERYHLVLDLEADRLTVPSTARLRERLAVELDLRG